MIFFILFFLSLILPIYTDNVILKNGKEYKNVKITMTEKEIEILSPTRKDTFSRKMVQSIKFKPVFWNTTPGKKEIAEERLRAIDLLMENPMWQPQKDQKCQLAIFAFKA
ncbi:MAG: hypothetical protein KDK36_08875 [Leptospiraceae bacterium]|nr:hypothetical protein [Leptospiraceae bacterium]